MGKGVRCKVRGCKGKHTAHGYCKKHFMTEFFKLHVSVALPGQEATRCCSVDKCYIVTYAKGMCKNHYQLAKKYKRVRKPSEMCSVGGCKRRWVAKGLCQMHYGRVRMTGKTGGAAKTLVTSTCKVPGCEKKHLAKNMCQMHYKRWKATGDTGPGYSTWEIRRHCAVPGCTKKHVGLGLCAMHRMRLKKTGGVGPVENTKPIKGWFLIGTGF